MAYACATKSAQQAGKIAKLPFQALSCFVWKGAEKMIPATDPGVKKP